MSSDDFEWLKREVERNRLSGNDIDVPLGPSVPVDFKEFEGQFDG